MDVSKYAAHIRDWHESTHLRTATPRLSVCSVSTLTQGLSPS